MPTTSTRDVEKGSFHHQDHDDIRRSPIQFTPEQYERLFLQPGGRAPSAGNLAQTFGNPTPLAIMSHLLVLTPTACFLMGWGGANATSLVSIVGAYYLVGGLGLVIAGVMEWILGNTFPFIVFVTFGGFWMSLGTLQDPLHGIAAAFTGGATSVAYNKGLMFYFAFWAVTCLVYFMASLRTNVVFSVIFITLFCTFILLSAAFGQMGDGDVSSAATLLKAAGSFAWVCICFAWYLIVALVFGSVDMPMVLPLGDLSGFMAKRKTA